MQLYGFRYKSTVPFPLKDFRIVLDSCDILVSKFDEISKNLEHYPNNWSVIIDSNRNYVKTSCDILLDLFPWEKKDCINVDQSGENCINNLNISIDIGKEQNITTEFQFGVTFGDFNDI